MNQKGTGKVKSRALCSPSWAGGAQLPSFLLCFEGDKKERTDSALMQPPSGRSVRTAGALEVLWMIAAVLPALKAGNEIRCSFFARPGSAPRSEHQTRLAYRISGTIPAFRKTYNALSSDPKNRPLLMHCIAPANSLWRYIFPTAWGFLVSMDFHFSSEEHCAKAK